MLFYGVDIVITENCKILIPLCFHIFFYREMKVDAPDIPERVWKVVSSSESIRDMSYSRIMVTAWVTTCS